MPVDPKDNELPIHFLKLLGYSGMMSRRDNFVIIQANFDVFFEIDDVIVRRDFNVPFCLN